MSVVLIVALLAAVALGVTETRRWASSDTFGAQLTRTLAQMVRYSLKALIWLWTTAFHMVIGEIRSW